jgi:rhodanese-related sulfurtransferase
MNLSMTSLLSAALLASSSLAFAVDLPIKKDGSYVSPQTVPGATTVDAAKAHELWKARVWFVDPRKPAEFDAGHVPGAINIEYSPSKPDKQKLTAATLEAEVPKSEAVLFYCNAEKCDRSSWGAALASEWGWKEVYYFRDGYPAWVAAGHPVQ